MKNAKLDQQHELEDLRLQLADKEAELLTLEMKDHLDSLRDLVYLLTRRVDTLENNVAKQNVTIVAAQKEQKNSTTNSKIFSLMTMITIISAIYYKFKH